MVHLSRRDVWREKVGETVSRTEEEWGGGGCWVRSGQGEQVDARADSWKRC